MNEQEWNDLWFWIVKFTKGQGTAGRSHFICDALDSLILEEGRPPVITNEFFNRAIRLRVEKFRHLLGI